MTPLPSYEIYDNNLNWAKFTDGKKSIELKTWRQPSTNNDPNSWNLAVGVNKSATTYTQGNLTNFASLAPKSIFMIPAAAGTVVVTFTAPHRAVGTVNFSFTHDNCIYSGINFTVQQVRQAQYRPFTAIIASGALLSTSCTAYATSGNESAPIALEAGDQINFIVRPTSPTNNYGTETTLTASIVVP